MKIVFFETTPENEVSLKEIINTVPELKDAQITFSSEILGPENTFVAKDANIISVFVKSMMTKEVIDSLPNLKLIVTRSTGFDHINSAHAITKSIKTANVPAYGSRTVAEFAFALILGLSRKTFAATLRVKTEGDFSYAGFEGFNLQGKTLGIVGTGRIGQNAIQIARGFDMNVIAFDAFPNTEAAAKLGFTYVSLDELLAKSDVVSLHVPYNKETHYLINTENIRKFKKGAILVNTARGEVCDNEALLMGVNEGILNGVALDVVEGERDHQKSKAIFDELLAHPNVFITPHMAFFSKEAQHEINMTSVENIRAFVGGEERNLVKV